MELILSAISAGGLVGAANQYMCLAIVSGAAKFGWITLSPQFEFIGSTWFLILVIIFWLVSVAPAYSSLLAPQVMNAVNAVSNFLHGFVVPLSAALITLASVGVIANIDPDLKLMLQSMQIFNPNGSLEWGAWLIAGGGAATAATLTGLKGLAKPAVSVSTGTAGHLAAPLFATLETLAAFVVMVGAYLLTKIDPWLLVALAVIVFLLTALMFAFAIYQLIRLKRGIGKLLYLAQVKPTAGLAVFLEFFVWGSGWLLWKKWGRGAIMLVIWIGAVLAWFAVQPLVIGLFAFFPPLIFFAFVMFNSFALAIYVGVGFNTAGALMQTLEKEIVFNHTTLATAG